MKIFAVTIILGYFSLGECFTKYGRTCKDIGCSSNEVCRMETKPCGYYDRQNDCGSYPTCVRANSGPRTCATHVCPPTQVCKMDGDTPKCVDDHSGKGFVGYNTQNQNDISQQNAGSNPSGGSIYPSIPRGETTPRPNVNYRPAAGGGYQGSQIGSGYPGQGGQGANRYPTGGYPQQSGGYPQQGGGYPQQGGGYPQQGGGYPQQQGGGYPQQYPQATGGYQGYSGYGGYQQGGYQGGSQGGYQGGQGGYQTPGYGNRYGQQSSGSSFTDKITDSLKSIGTDFLKNALNNYLSGRRN